ncbi:hypothetical protein AB0L26_12440 [Streptomyces nondiastaticus]|uniref:tetratricopeptide repeat protein n=1 Tax=Streptomyces nondiastaticus TaxID=3154512 RepID=UPI00341CF152
MPPTPDSPLRHLLAQAGWSHAQLAAAVRAVAAENGQALACDRSAVARWAHGTRPRPPVPQYLLEALRRRLGRTVTAQEAGLSRAPETALDSSWDADPLRNLTRLAHSELAPHQEESPVAGTYRLTALAVPRWDQLEPRPRLSRRPSAPNAGRRAGRTEVEALQTVTAFFAHAATRYGGGHARTALLCYLAHDVTPWLHAPATDSVHRQLLTAGAQLAILLGDMCADDSRDALAQHYHRTAARLAADADDPATYAVALHAMSTHAYELDHRPAALALSRQAADAARHHAHPAILTYTQAQLAVTEAGTHHRSSALAALHTAEHLHSSTEPSASMPFTTYPDAALDFQRARTLNALGDHVGTLSALTSSLRTHPPDRHRARALITAHLAEAQLRQGHREAALANWERFLGDYPTLRSARATRRLTAMRQLLEPHVTHPAAARLLHRATQLH